MSKKMKGEEGSRCGSNEGMEKSRKEKEKKKGEGKENKNKTELKVSRRREGARKRCGNGTKQRGGGSNKIGKVEEKKKVDGEDIGNQYVEKEGGDKVEKFDSRGGRERGENKDEDEIRV